LTEGESKCYLNVRTDADAPSMKCLAGRRFGQVSEVKSGGVVRRWWYLLETATSWTLSYHSKDRAEVEGASSTQAVNGYLWTLRFADDSSDVNFDRPPGNENSPDRRRSWVSIRRKRLRILRRRGNEVRMKPEKKFKEMTIVGIASDTRNMQPVVILKETVGERELYIWIGPVEAMALQRAMNKEVFQRPLTHELLRNIIDKSGVVLEHIEIDDLKDHTYYATIYLKNLDSKLITVDARPSDSLVLATWTGVPIFVSEKVIEGMTQPDQDEAIRHKVIFTQEDVEGTDEELTKILERMNPDDLGNA
jgi:uncharacterized protein